jgi:hypothetical protein
MADRALALHDREEHLVDRALVVRDLVDLVDRVLAVDLAAQVDLVAQVAELVGRAEVRVDPEVDRAPVVAVVLHAAAVVDDVAVRMISSQE